MSLTVGGGQDGSGNATLADGSANDATASPVLTGRGQLDYAVQLAKGLAVNLDAVDEDTTGSDLTQFRVIAVGDETIVAEEFDGTTVGATVQIARTNDQRRSFYDGQEFQLVVDGETKNLLYTYVSATERTVTDTDTGQVTTQEIRPRYKGGDIIFAGTPTNGTGVSTATLIDVNVDGRKFTDIQVGAQQLIVKSEQYDYWVCRNLIAGEEGDADVYVAKPSKLRRAGIGLADIGTDFEGIEYTYAFNGSTIERTAEIVANGCTQQEILIPRMVFDNDVIYAISVDSTGVNDPNDQEITLVDVNADARFWSRIK